MQMSIKQAGEQTGLSADTLRYYERLGLLGDEAHNAGRQRRYTPDDIAQLRFVRRAQAMDFSLDEIGQLLLTTCAPKYTHSPKPKWPPSRNVSKP